MKPSRRIGVTVAAIVLSTVAMVLGIVLLSATAANGLRGLPIVTVDSTSLPQQLSRSLASKLQNQNIDPADFSLLLPKGTRQDIYFADGSGGLSESVDVAEPFFSYTPPAQPPFNGTYLTWRSFAFAFKDNAADRTADGGPARAAVKTLGDGLDQALLQWETSSAGIVDPSSQGQMLVAGTVMLGLAALLLLAAFLLPARRGDTISRRPFTARLLYGALAGCAGGGGALMAGLTSDISHTISGLTPSYVLVSEQTVMGIVLYTSSNAFLVLAWAASATGLMAGVAAGFLIEADYKVRKSYATLSDSNELETPAFQR